MPCRSERTWLTPVLILLLLIGCSDGGSKGIPIAAVGSGSGSGSSGSGSSTGSGTAASAPDLVSATHEDTNQSGAIDSGDILRLRFNGPVPAGLGLADVRFSNPKDGPGTGARLDVRVGGNEALIHLGQGPSLSIYDTYVPNDQVNGSPLFVSPDPSTGIGGGPVRARPAANANVGYFGRTFPDNSNWRAYYGTLHAHTTKSDGADAPGVAIDWARNQGKLDFFALTDHLEQLHLFSHKYPDSRTVVDLWNEPGRFVTLLGYEWGGGPTGVAPLTWTNHCNVLGDPGMMPLKLDLRSFYAELQKRTPRVVGQFNHPGRRRQGPLHLENWDDYRYDPLADRRMALMRCEPGDHEDVEGYIPALDKGWHLAPQSSQDNHSADWGTKNDYRTGLFLPVLERSAILQALAEMRSFSTSDKDASLRVVADQQWAMGSTLTGSGPHTLDVTVTDAGSELFQTIELITLKGQVAATHNPGSASSHPVQWQVQVDPKGDRYYYVRATQADGDRLYSAPFFIDR